MKTLESAARNALAALEVIAIATDIEWVNDQALKQVDVLREALEHPTSFLKERAQLHQEWSELKRLQAQYKQPAPQQEPVAWRVHPFDYGIGAEGVYAITTRKEQVKAWHSKGWNVESLYVAPQQRKPWVGLTDDERAAVVDEYFGSFAAALMIEAKLREKNT